MLSSLFALSGLAAIASVEAAHEFQQHKRISAAALYRRAGGFIPAEGYETERKPPKDWAYEKLEPYELYHFRYIHIKCAESHGTAFFDKCCGPRDAGKLDDEFDYACRLEAHTDVKPKQLEKQMKAANAAASGDRREAIKSISSESYASAHPTTKKVHSHKPKPTSEPPVVTSEPPVTTSKVHSHKPTHTPKTSAEESETPETTKEKPSHTPKPKPDPSTSADEPEPTQDDGGNNGGGGGGGIGGVIGDIIGDLITGGSATWFEQNGNPGACGEWHSDSDFLVAIQESRYNGGAECGRKVKVTNTATGAAVIAVALDLCPSCQDNPNSLDLSLAAFGAIGAMSAGVLPITYGYVSPDTPLGPV